MLSCLHLEAIEHQLVANVLTHVLDVLQAHRFKCLAFLFLQEINLVLRSLGDVANLGPPLVHVLSLFIFHFNSQVLKVLIFDLGLHAPVLLSVLLASNGNVFLELLPLIFEVIVYFTSDSNPETKLSLWHEEGLSLEARDGHFLVHRRDNGCALKYIEHITFFLI